MQKAVFTLAWGLAYALLGSCGFEEYDYIAPAPAELFAENITHDTFVLTWTDIYSSSEYLAEVSTSLDFPADEIVFSQSTRTNRIRVQGSGIDPFLAYHCRVSSIDEEGDSHGGYSPTLTVQLAPMSVPQLSFAQEQPLAFNGYRIAWDSIDHAENYLVHIAPDTSFNPLVADFVAFTTPARQFEFEAPDFFKTYYVRVQATAAPFSSAWSPIFPVAPRRPPAYLRRIAQDSIEYHLEHLPGGTDCQLNFVRLQQHQADGSVASLLRTDLSYTNGLVTSAHVSIPDQNEGYHWSFEYTPEQVLTSFQIKTDTDTPVLIGVRTYNAQGLLVQVTLTYPLENETITVDFSYDTEGNVIEQSQSDGQVFTFTYDSNVSPYYFVPEAVQLLLPGPESSLQSSNTVTPQALSLFPKRRAISSISATGSSTLNLENDYGDGLVVRSRMLNGQLITYNLRPCAP